MNYWSYYGIAIISCLLSSACTHSFGMNDSTRLQQFDSSHVIDLSMVEKNHDSMISISPDDEFFSHRVIGNAVAVSENEQAAAVMRSILEKGGSAVDAAIAGAFVLAVVEPHASGVWGNGLALVYDNNLKEVMVFNGQGMASERFNKIQFNSLNLRWSSQRSLLNSGLAVSIPGQVDMLWKLHKKAGILSWEELCDPAIKLAKNGFYVSPQLEIAIQKILAVRKVNLGFKELFMHYGDSVEIGDKIKNPELAELLIEIQKNGYKGFYRDIAARFRQDFSQHPYLSLFTTNDFEKFSTIVSAAECQEYQDVRICVPQNLSGGSVVLEILELLERSPFEFQKSLSASYYHYLVNAQQLSYADFFMYNGDPLFDEEISSQLLEDKYLDKRSMSINVSVGNLDIFPGIIDGISLSDSSVYGTSPVSASHLSVVDHAGNAITMTLSLEQPFGSFISYRGSFLNSSLSAFSFIDDVVDAVNLPERCKRPRSIMTPTLVFDKSNNQLQGIFGTSGGLGTMGHTAQMLVCMYERNLSPEVCLQQPVLIGYPSYLSVEMGHPDSYNILNMLQQRYKHVMQPEFLISAFNMIIHVPELEQWRGYIDPRYNGSAVSVQN